MAQQEEVGWMWIFVNKKRQNRLAMDVFMYVDVASVCVCEKTESKCCEE
jgi:hypothetical protein